MTIALWHVIHDSNFATFPNASPSPAPGAVGDGWTDTMGSTYGITSGVLTQSGNHADTAYTLLRPLSEAIANCRIRAYGSGTTMNISAQPGLLLRYQDSGNFYVLFFIGTDAYIFKYVSGGSTQLATVSWTLPATWYVEFSAVGTLLTLALYNAATDALVATTSVSDSTYATGRQGLTYPSHLPPITRMTTLVPLSGGIQISGTVATGLLYAGDVGSTLLVTVKDSTGAALDLSNATSVSLILQSPNSAVNIVTPTPVNTGSDGQYFYVFQSTDIPVGRDGIWSYQVKYVLSGTTYHTSVSTFNVARSMV